MKNFYVSSAKVQFISVPFLSLYTTAGLSLIKRCVEYPRPSVGLSFENIEESFKFYDRLWHGCFRKLRTLAIAQRPLHCPFQQPDRTTLNKYSGHCTLLIPQVSELFLLLVECRRQSYRVPFLSIEAKPMSGEKNTRCKFQQQRMLVYRPFRRPSFSSVDLVLTSTVRYV